MEIYLSILPSLKTQQISTQRLNHMLIMSAILTMGLGLPSVLLINGVKIQVKQKGRQSEKNSYLYRNRNLNQRQTFND